jgi:hypothetical protein
LSRSRAYCGPAPAGDQALPSVLIVPTGASSSNSWPRPGPFWTDKAPIPESAGISDPDEPPEDAEVILETAKFTSEGAAPEAIPYLEREGYVRC